MNNHRCISQKSLITVRKWLLQAGDSLSTPIYLPSSKFDHNIKQKFHVNKIIKRKRFNHQKYYPKITSIIDWFYEFIKNIFTIYDQSPLKCNEQIHNHTIDDTTLSITTCSTCQFENFDAHLNTIQTTLKLSKSSSVLQSKINGKIMMNTGTSSSNLNTSQSVILRSSKSTQTNHHEQHSTVYPLYCFSVKDGQVLLLQFSSSSSSTVIPIVKEIISSSSSLCINDEKCKYCNLPVDSSVPLLTTDIHSYSSYQPTIVSIPSSHSNTISLQTTQNFPENHIISKIHRPLSSLHDTHICHFDKHNCLIECYHSSSTNPTTPEIVFAENTCQLIKQAWLSSTSDHQTNLKH